MSPRCCPALREATSSFCPWVAYPCYCHFDYYNTPCSHSWFEYFLWSPFLGGDAWDLLFAPMLNGTRDSHQLASAYRAGFPFLCQHRKSRHCILCPIQLSQAAGQWVPGVQVPVLYRSSWHLCLWRAVEQVTHSLSFRLFPYFSILLRVLTFAENIILIFQCLCIPVCPSSYSD